MQVLGQRAEAGEPAALPEGGDGRHGGGDEGAASYALTCDFVDEDAYRIYDADAEHNRIRREMFAPISAVVERVQFRLP